MIIRPFCCIISPQELNRDEFELSSMRCGRKLSKDGDVSGPITFLFTCVFTVDVLIKFIFLFSQYCWRWTGFNFGFDLLVTYTNRYIVFKRNTLSQPGGGAVSLQPRRHLAYRSVVLLTHSQMHIKVQQQWVVLLCYDFKVFSTCFSIEWLFFNLPFDHFY